MRVDQPGDTRIARQVDHSRAGGHRGIAAPDADDRIAIDHDDRVFPAHSFKYTAAMQAAQAGDAPILIRIETKAGHGAGKPTSKQIEETADIYGFLVKNLGMK